MLDLLLSSAMLAPPEVAERPVAEAIVVDPGASCLQAERLAEQASTWLGVQEVDERIVVEVVGDPDDPTRVTFTLERDGEVIAVRRFDPAPKACADRHAVVGLAIALALDATLLETVSPPKQPDPEPELDPEPEPDPDPDPEPEPEPDPEPDPDPDPEPQRPPWHLHLGLGGGLSLNAPPSIGGFGELGLEASWRELVDIRVGGMAGSSGPQSVGTGRAVLTVAAGRADVCAGPWLRRLRPRGCAGVLVGAALAAGQGFAEDRTERLPWVAFALGADLRIRLVERLAVEISAEGLINAVRPAFDFLDPSGFRRQGRLFPLFGGMFAAGLVVTLW